MDRVRDAAVVVAALMSANQFGLLGLVDIELAIFGIVVLGLWNLYIYIVDAYLNPMRRELEASVDVQPYRYMGLYDLFIYGAILLLLIDSFSWFLLYLGTMALVGVGWQLRNMKRLSEQLGKREESR